MFLDKVLHLKCVSTDGPEVSMHIFGQRTASLILHATRCRMSRYLTSYSNWRLRALVRQNSKNPETVYAISSYPGFDAHLLTRPGLFLDAETLDRCRVRLNEQIGAVPAHAGSRFAQAVARRIAFRLARQHEGTLQVPAQTLAEAWYFALWCELSTLIPLRQLARHIAKSSDGNLVLVPVAVRDGTYLSYWDCSSLEPYMLALEVRRAGGNALLVFCDLEATPGAQPFPRASIILSYKPHTMWDVPPTPTNAAAQDAGMARKTLVLSGIRGGLRLMAKIGGARLVQGPYTVTQVSTHESLLRQSDTLPTVALVFRRLRRKMFLPTGVNVFACTLPETSLLTWFGKIVGPRTREAAREASRIVTDQEIAEAHVCDHMFFESALVAGAVRNTGGRVVVWPHSSNAIHLPMRRSAQPDEVYCVRRSQAAAWTASFGRVPTNIMSELLFSPFQGARSPVASAPLTVVIIAGAHTLNRIPIVNITEHTESYRRLFAGLASLAPKVRIVCKAKSPFESFEWLASLAPVGATIERTDVSPNSIDLPNMIFVSVSYGSTALMEGLSRGIPCMVVRETPVEDYAPVDPESVPIGSVETILIELTKCMQPTYFSEMGKKQFDWFVAETNFSSGPKVP